jgi:hypothetical protein
LCQPVSRLQVKNVSTEETRRNAIDRIGLI